MCTYAMNVEAKLLGVTKNTNGKGQWGEWRGNAVEYNQNKCFICMIIPLWDPYYV